jgi:hypothetical protein
MSEEPKKRPGVGFWATVIVPAVLAYPASFGPACWIGSRADILVDKIPSLYHPVLWAMSRNESTYRALEFYTTVGAARGWGWIDLGDPEGELDWIWMKCPPPPTTISILVVPSR